MHSVREFVELAFSRVGTAIEWSGSGVDEVGKDASSGKTIVRVDPVYFRPTEVEQLLADPSRAKKELGWSHKTSFEDLVAEMVDADLQAITAA